MNRQKALAALAVIAVFMLAEVPFGLAAWVAAGQAPETEGPYEILVQATYNGIRGVLPLQLVVNETPLERGNLTIEPVYPFETAPPITLRYDISLGGSRDFELISGNVTVYYESGGSVLKSEKLSLEKSGDYWEAVADVPLKGGYKAVISLVVEKGGRRFGGQFMTRFTSDAPSDRLVLSHSISKRILLPGEQFDVSMEAVFDGVGIPELNIFKASLYGEIKTLGWDQNKRLYRNSFIAPEKEGIYAVNIYAEGQGAMAQKRIYVAETSKPKSGRCPIGVREGASCTDMRDVRRCAADWGNGTIILTEDQIAECFESATKGVKVTDIACNPDYKGDLNGDGEMTPADLDLFGNLILPQTASNRREYANCADYDLDGDVDEDDLKCMANVVAGKWWGDAYGGICFDVAYDSPLKGDMDGNNFVQNEDVIIMRDLIATAKAGIKTPRAILDFVDFNRDKNLTQRDMQCMEYFVGMELAKPETLLAYGRTIPADCMKIYNLDKCQGVRGDLNGDLKIDNVDEILIMLAQQDQITGYDLECADVNKELGVTIEDVECVKAYTAGDKDFYFVCIGCNENTPEDYRRPYEICGDGFDNDCNGLVDRTSKDPNKDYCRCITDTPCWMVWDMDRGVSPGIDDGNVRVCRKASWKESSNAGGAASEYNWMLPPELMCTKEQECQSVECNETRWKCAFDGMQYEWYEKPSDMPVETDDPLAVPKLCEDGHDNDCWCGDKKCKKIDKGGGMGGFLSTIIGVVVGILCMVIPGLQPIGAWLLANSFYIMLASTAISFVSPELGGFLGGLTLGANLALLGSQALGTGLGKAATAAQTAGQDVAKDLIGTSATDTLGATGNAGEAISGKAFEQGVQQAGEAAVSATEGTLNPSLAKTLGENAFKTANYGAEFAGAGKILGAIGAFAKTALMGTSPFVSVAFGIASKALTCPYASSKKDWGSKEKEAC